MTIETTGARVSDLQDENEPAHEGGVVAEDRGAARSRSRRRAVLPQFVAAWHARGRHLRGELAEAGMATAEYAIATLAAVGFAGLLVVILKGNEVKGLLSGIIRQALSL